METNITAPLDDLISPIARVKSSHVTVFTDFCKMAACALSMQRREDEYLEVIKGYSHDEIDSLGKALGVLVNIMQDHPYQDVLGAYYLEIASRFSKKDRGEFYTPDCIAELMARLLINADAVKANGKPVRISEPTCGSGNMILALAKTLSPDAIDLMRVTCQDISPLACDMCFINTTLWGIPAKIIWGNTLTLEQRKVWTNIHWLRVGENVRELFRIHSSPVIHIPQSPVTKEGQTAFEW